MRECTCFKVHIYGRCEVCKEWYAPKNKEVLELIKKYPFTVKELIYGN